jgi:hypothetical protein
VEGMRRALLVGIDEYGDDSLTGCVSDALRMQTMLEKHHDGSPNFACKLLAAPGGFTDEITRASLRGHLEQLFQHPAEVAYFHFSGHGTTTRLDGLLWTQDGVNNDEGVSLTEVLTMANASKAQEVVITLDCCFSGHAGSPALVDGDKSLLREGLCILTGSRNNQVSVETGGNGVFSSLVVDALDGGAANLLGGVTAPAIYMFVEAALGAWDQRPLFKSNLSRAVDLRKAAPPISQAILRKLPVMFPLPAEDLALNPTFERTHASAIDANVAQLEELQALYRVHLVTPVDAVHMYDAVMKSTGCRLTPSGRYYWRLAKNQRI